MKNVTWKMFEEDFQLYISRSNVACEQYELHSIKSEFSYSDNYSVRCHVRRLVSVVFHSDKQHACDLKSCWKRAREPQRETARLHQRKKKENEKKNYSPVREKKNGISSRVRFVYVRNKFAETELRRGSLRRRGWSIGRGNKSSDDKQRWSRDSSRGWKPAVTRELGFRQAGEAGRSTDRPTPGRVGRR